MRRFVGAGSQDCVQRQKRQDRTGGHGQDAEVAGEPLAVPDSQADD